LALHVDRFLLFALHSLHFLCADLLGRPFTLMSSDNWNIDRLYDEDCFLDHGVASVGLDVLLRHALKLISCNDLMLDRSFVIHVIHHVEEGAGR